MLLSNNSKIGKDWWKLAETKQDNYCQDLRGEFHYPILADVSNSHKAIKAFFISHLSKSLQTFKIQGGMVEVTMLLIQFEKYISDFIIKEC